MSRNARNNENWEIWRKFAKCLAKIKNVQRGPLKRGDVDENGDLVKFAPQVEQKF